MFILLAFTQARYCSCCILPANPISSVPKKRITRSLVRLWWVWWWRRWPVCGCWPSGVAF